MSTSPSRKTTKRTHVYRNNIKLVCIEANVEIPKPKDDEMNARHRNKIVKECESTSKLVCTMVPTCPGMRTQNAAHGAERQTSRVAVEGVLHSKHFQVSNAWSFNVIQRPALRIIETDEELHELQKTHFEYCTPVTRNRDGHKVWVLESQVWLTVRLRFTWQRTMEFRAFRVWFGLAGVHYF